MDIFYYNEEKLKYVIKRLNLSNKEIAEKLEINRTLVANIQSYHQNRLRKCHIYAFCYAFDIPIEIFENQDINTKEQIDNILLKRKDIFIKDYELLEKLKGKWYLYSYPSNLGFADVWETITIINSDFSVEDMHQNRGKLLIGRNQSIILKESHNSKNITSITFDNNRVTYGKFAFSRVSKSNLLNKELFNFGFFSREKLPLDKAKEILGDRSEVQLQIKEGLLERINRNIDMIVG